MYAVGTNVTLSPMPMLVEGTRINCDAGKFWAVFFADLDVFCAVCKWDLRRNVEYHYQATLLHTQAIGCVDIQSQIATVSGNF